MNRRQKIVQQQFLDNEEAVIKRLDQVYRKSLDDISKRVAELNSSIDTLRKAYDSVTDDEIGELAAAFLKKNQHLTPDEARETLQSMIQSKVYQKDYQKALKKQVWDILDTMHQEEFKTVSEYLDKCYEEGFIGTMYDLQGQGIPMCFPLDQEAMVTAVQLDSKISHGLYTRLGEDVAMLKKKITAQVSRGVATAMTYQQIAQQLAGVSNIGYNNAVRIARTEGHRIQCQSGMDACYKAKEKGADVVKQWDATLDGRTRESHAAVDGEYRELDEKFSNGLEFPGDPHGKAAEVINCRCALLQRARWAIGGGFTKMNNFTKELETFDSPEAYDEFKKAFFSPENKKYMNYVQQMEEKYGTKNFEKVLGSMNNREYKRYKELLDGNPMFHKQAAKANGKKVSHIPQTPELEQKRQAVSEYLRSLGAAVDSDGMVTLYHATDKANIPKIKKDGFKPTNAPVNGGTGGEVIQERVFFGYNKDWIKETWSNGGNYEVMTVKIPAEYLHQFGNNTQEIVVEGVIKQEDDGIWIPDILPTSTAWDRKTVKRWLKKKGQA